MVLPGGSSGRQPAAATPVGAVVDVVHFALAGRRQCHVVTTAPTRSDTPPSEGSVRSKLRARSSVTASVIGSLSASLGVLGGRDRHGAVGREVGGLHRGRAQGGERADQLLTLRGAQGAGATAHEAGLHDDPPVDWTTTRSSKSGDAAGAPQGHRERRAGLVGTAADAAVTVGPVVDVSLPASMPGEPSPPGVAGGPAARTAAVWVAGADPMAGTATPHPPSRSALTTTPAHTLARHMSSILRSVARWCTWDRRDSRQHFGERFKWQASGRGCWLDRVGRVAGLRCNPPQPGYERDKHVIPHDHTPRTPDGSPPDGVLDDDPPTRTGPATRGRRARGGSRRPRWPGPDRRPSRPGAGDDRRRRRRQPGARLRRGLRRVRCAAAGARGRLLRSDPLGLQPRPQHLGRLRPDAPRRRRSRLAGRRQGPRHAGRPDHGRGRRHAVARGVPHRARRAGAPHGRARQHPRRRRPAGRRAALPRPARRSLDRSRSLVCRRGRVVRLRAGGRRRGLRRRHLRRDRGRGLAQDRRRQGRLPAARAR